MKMKWLGFAAIFVAGVLAFQNCSNVNFSDAKGSSSLASQSVDTSLLPTPTPSPGGTTLTAVPEMKCLQFVELTVVDGQTLNIPARSSGICYVAKIISSASFSPSRKNPLQDMDVYSNNHDTYDGTSIHPYILGQRLVRISLQGVRKIKLSGGKNDTAKILVDNFILTGVAPLAQIGDPSFFRAYGTKDSAVTGTTTVLFKAQGVPLKAFTSGGTSTIAPLELEGTIEINRDYALDIRALDAGDSGQNSDIYLLFN